MSAINDLLLSTSLSRSWKCPSYQLESSVSARTRRCRKSAGSRLAISSRGRPSPCRMRNCRQSVIQQETPRAEAASSARTQSPPASCVGCVSWADQRVAVHRLQRPRDRGRRSSFFEMRRTCACGATRLSPLREPRARRARRGHLVGVALAKTRPASAARMLEGVECRTTSAAGAVAEHETPARPGSRDFAGASTDRRNIATSLSHAELVHVEALAVRLSRGRADRRRMPLRPVRGQPLGGPARTRRCAS